MPAETIPKYLAKGRNGFWHSWGFTFQDFHEPIRIRPENARVLQQNCVRCHSELVSDVRAPYHDSADVMDCVRCHQSVGHGPPR